MVADFAINYVLDTASIVSGGKINQLQRFCKFVNLGRVSATSFYRNQRLYVIPAIEQDFEETSDAIIQELQTRSKSVILCGDCQLDYAGWSATIQRKLHGSIEFSDKLQV